MERLHILLKNGKELRSKEVPYVQAMHWRKSLMHNHTIMFASDNGLKKIEGAWVKSTKLHRDAWNTEEVAAAMLLFPCMVYECEKGYYQYSDVSHSYERASKHKGYWTWTQDALPLSSSWKPCTISF